LKQSVDHYAGDGSAKDIIAWFGGYEMVMAIGGMLRAAELRMIILVDGFIMTNCILAASKLHPEVLSYAIFGHQGDETGHKLVLDAMKVFHCIYYFIGTGIPDTIKYTWSAFEAIY
jgi:nicotinate-nucleotide--dimethylbenzimidazole phosphoribosyltransferase